MLHIHKAKIKTIVNGAGKPAWQAWFELSDGQVVVASAAMLKTGRFQADQDLLWLEGVSVESDLINSVEGLTKENWPEVSVELGFLLNIAAAKVLAKVNKISLHLVLAEQFKVTINLPQPIVNIFNGGSYGDTNLDFDEFLILPTATNKLSLVEKIKQLTQVRLAVGTLLFDAGLDIDIGAFGGYAPELVSSVRAFELMATAVAKTGLELGVDYNLGVDVGAWHLFDPIEHKYLFSLDRHHLDALSLVALYNDWLAKYNVIYLEDAAAAEDKIGWRELSSQWRSQLILAGDDLINDRSENLKMVAKEHLVNTVVIHPSRHVSLAALSEYCKIARRHNYNLVVAVETEETNDDWLVDLAVALGADFIKAGSLARGEFVAKYNRLIEIENELSA